MNFSWVFKGITQAGNLGFIARLLSNFDHNDFRLIDSCDHLSFEAKKFSAGNESYLVDAKCYESIDQAVANFDLVIGTTARARDRMQKIISIKELPEKIMAISPQSIAFLFGNEASGLSNQELQSCNLICYIPTAAKNSSLNLSHAVAIVMYQMQELQNKQQLKKYNFTKSLATNSELNDFKDHLFTYLTDIGFVNAHQVGVLKNSLSAIFNRVNLTSKELAILRAMVGKSESVLKLKNYGG